MIWNTERTILLMAFTMLLIASALLYSSYVSSESDRNIIETLRDVVEKQREINESLVHNQLVSSDLHGLMLDDIIELCSMIEKCQLFDNLPTNYKTPTLGTQTTSEYDGCLYEIREILDDKGNHLTYYYHKLECP